MKFMSAITDDGVKELTASKRALLELRLKKIGLAGVPRIMSRSCTGPTPLSSAQHRMWMRHQLDPVHPNCNTAQHLRLHGPLDVAALRHALVEILRRHEVLRSRFSQVGDHLEQTVDPNVALEIPLSDLSELPADQRERVALQLAGEQEAARFDLQTGPLVRARLLRLGAREHLLLLTIHHIAFDGWSRSILKRELAVLYEAFSQCRPLPLAPLPLQYADFAAWEAESIQSDWLKDQLDYWKQKLSGNLTMLEVPTDHPRPAVCDWRGGRMSRRLSPELSRAIKDLADASGATLFITMLAAFQTLLWHYTREDDMVIGSPVAGRSDAQTEALIGCLINMLALRTNLGGDPSFRELLSRTRETALGAYENQHVPLERLVQELRPPRNAVGLPFFQVVFNYRNIPPAPLPAEPGDADPSEELRIEPFGPATSVAVMDLSLEMVHTQDGLECTFEYDSALFESSTIQRMLGQLESLLRSIVADPSRPISRLSLIDEQERRTVTEQWNQTQAEFSRDRCIHHLFEDWAARTPDAVALRWIGGQLTYRQLNQRAEQIAQIVRAEGGGPNVPVGICMERCADTIVAILGVLKAGSACLPLDPAHPRERFDVILANAGFRTLLTQRPFASQFLGADLKLIFVEEALAAPFTPSQNRSAATAAATDLCYVIYTSGSTGVPKGVALEHRSVVNLVESARWIFNVSQADSILQFCALIFDISIVEIFAALCSGATLVLRNDQWLGSVAGFLSHCADQGVTIMDLPTTYFHELVLGLDGQAHRLPFCIRLIATGGEALLPQRLARWKSVAGRSVRLLNLYGPTETTVFSTAWNCEQWFREDKSELARCPIGRPIRNTTAYVLDHQLQPVPIGVPGELYLGGAGLARGYLNRPELTAERFIADPFDPTGTGRLYRTGDVARWLPDGNLEFIGRADRQIKMRGFRIELGEIESVLHQHPQIREAAVLAWDHEGDKRLAAYVTLKSPGSLSESAVHEFLSGKLPAYMVPAAIVILEQFPLTPSGKLDRRALARPEPDANRLQTRAYAAPRDALEEILTGIFQDVLGVTQVGIHDSFFDLGGHSLRAVQFASRVRDALHVELPLRRLFEMPTVADIAQTFQSLQAQSHKQSLPIAPLEPDVQAPLSFAQESLWFLDQYESDRSIYNIPLPLRLSGSLDVGVLQETLSRIVSRHEALRTVFVAIEGEPRQKIIPPAPFELPVVSVEELGEPERLAKSRELAVEEICRPFDLTAGPLLRGRLLRLSAQEHVLVLTMHHIISDGWSVGILFEELEVIYRALSSGQEPHLPELAVQFAPFAVWQRQWLSGAVLERQLSYWRQRLAGAPALLELPSDRPRPAVLSYRGDIASLTLPRELCEALKDLSRSRGVTLFMTLLAGFKILLHRCSGQEDIVVGSPVAGRPRSEVEPLIGLFTNSLVLRTDLSGNPTVAELLGRVREVALGAYDHQDLPFEKLVEELKPQRNRSYLPLFQVMLVLQNAPSSKIQIPGLGVQRMDLHTATAKFDLILSWEEIDDNLIGTLEYSTDLFDAATIQRMLYQLRRLYQGMVDDPRRRIEQLPMLGEAERQKILVEWNDTQREYPRDACIHELFQWQARRTPDAVALVFQDQHLTYRQLDQKANQLAHHLRKLGVGPDVLVAICLERSLEMIVGLLGILKAGGAYVPLDAMYPKERLAFMLGDTQARVLLTQNKLLPSLPQGAAKIVCLDADSAAIQSNADTNPAVNVAADNLAYVIYTSGSTGEPKGVLVPHRGVMRLVCGAQFAKFGPNRVYLQMAPISFDASTLEIWAPLLHGGRCVVHPDQLSTPGELGQILRQHNVTTLWLTSSLFNLIIEQDAAALGGLDELLIGGEALSVAHVRRALELLPNTQIINGYGPTESTTFACCYPIPRTLAADLPSIPIGRPISNTRVFILDSYGQPVPIKIPGELHIGGDGLARGYLNRPELTAERFIADPFDPTGTGRLYRTGDVARWMPDGNLEFIGRADRQIKMRGFRIELGEIESVLHQHPQIREAAVLAWDHEGDKRLAAYVTLKSPGSLSESAVHEFLSGKLPAYMVPAAIVILEQFPLTPSGKLDRSALVRPFWTRIVRDKAPSDVRDSIEEALSSIWMEVLGVERIGIHDDFFELGGHSLLAVRMLSIVNETFGVSLPLATLFSGATIEQLACAVQEYRPQNLTSLVACLREGDGLPPLFFVHGDVAADGLYCRNLIRHLDRRQPFYALHTLGTDGGPLPERIEDMAAFYLRLVRQARPHGPYLIGGFCNGGLIAYEMAQQLRAEGETVEATVLVAAPAYQGKLRAAQRVVHTFGELAGAPFRRQAALNGRLRRIHHRWHEAGSDRWQNRIRGIAQELSEGLRNLVLGLFSARPAQPQSPPDADPGADPGIHRITPQTMNRIFRHLGLAIASYRPKPYDGRVLFFWPIGEADWQRRGAIRAWKRMARRLEVRYVPGNHMTCCTTHAQILGQHLRTAFKNSHDAAGGKS
jgi:amino acid adenylation domain-containing protein